MLRRRIRASLPAAAKTPVSRPSGGRSEASPRPRLADSLLPPELWDLIFRYIFADHWLLRLAGTCRAFNSIATALYFRRNPQVAAKLDAAHLRIDAELVDALATALSVRLSATRVLEAWLSTTKLLEALHALRVVVCKTTTGPGALTELRLSWWKGFWPDESRKKSRPYAEALWSIVAILASKISPSGPRRVLVMYSNNDKGHLYNFAHFRSDSRASCLPRFYDILESAQQNLNKDRQMTVFSVTSGSTPYTFVVLSVAARMLALGTETSLGEDISQVIPLITLPHLQILDLHHAGIPPAVLSNFLMRHPTLEKLRYFGKDPSKPLCLPPAPLPRLREIDCPDPRVVHHILDGVRFDPQVMMDKVSFGILLAPSLDKKKYDANALLIALRAVSNWATAHSTNTVGPRITLDIRISEAASARPIPPSPSTIGKLKLSGLEGRIEQIRLIGGPHWWPGQDEVNLFRPWVQATMPSAAHLISAWAARGELWGDDVVESRVADAVRGPYWRE